ncbi:hypothetical protein AA313_de0202675 [Arthrobotrys entomopaga]|nr:hypothetical protein AA313_de0202675 [Arthrobotrys entomopaga]
MQDARAIRQAATSCQESLKKSLEIPRLKENGWAENRLIDFNLWATGAGVSARGKLSLDERLASKPEVKETVINLLNLLQLFSESYQEQATSAENSRSSDIEAPQINAESQPLALSPSEIEARKDVEVTIDQIIRLTVAIRKAGSDARLKRADKSFDPGEPESQALRGFLELVVPPRGFKEESQLTSIQCRLIEANLRRRHRFSYAKLHSEKLAGNSSKTQAKKVPQMPQSGTLLSEIDATGAVPRSQRRDHITEEEKPKPQVIQPAPSTIAPTLETAASAIEGTIIVTEKKATKAAATVISRIASKIEYPRPPRVEQFQTVFRCPCCHQTLPVALTERTQWKKHLASDILPYTCVFENCARPLQFYLTRRDWENHIKNDHGQLWTCFVCGEADETVEFNDEGSLVDHIRTKHHDSVDFDEIAMYVDASCSSKPAEATGCPLCAGPREGEDFFEHIAQCVHDFSLRSLPPPPENDAQEIYFDIDSNASSSQNITPSSQAEEKALDELSELEYESEETEAAREKSTQITDALLKSLALSESQGLPMKGLDIMDWVNSAQNGDPDAEDNRSSSGSLEISNIDVETAGDEETPFFSEGLGLPDMVINTAEEPDVTPEPQENDEAYMIGWICTTRDCYLAALILFESENPGLRANLLGIAGMADGDNPTTETLPRPYVECQYRGRKVVFTVLHAEAEPIYICAREMVIHYPTLKAMVILSVDGGYPGAVTLGDVVIGIETMDLSAVLSTDSDDAGWCYPDHL